MPGAKPNVPRSGSNIDISLAPTGAALATTVDATISTATDLALQTDTTFLRVYAINQDVCLRWGAAASRAASATDFDEIIPAGQIVDIVRATDSSGALYATCNFIERVAGGTAIIIEKR